MMDNAFPIKKHNQHHLDLWPTRACFFWTRRPFPHPLRRLHLSFIIPINPRLISCYDTLKFSLPFALASSSWLISTRFSFWSSVNKRGTNFALTRLILSFPVKIWWQDPMLMPTSLAASRTVKRFPRITARTLEMVVLCGRSSRPGILTDRHSALFKSLKPLIALRSAHTVLPVCLVKQLKCVKFLPCLQQNFTHARGFKLFHCHCH